MQPLNIPPLLHHLARRRCDGGMRAARQHRARAAGSPQAQRHLRTAQLPCTLHTSGESRRSAACRRQSLASVTPAVTFSAVATRVAARRWWARRQASSRQVGSLSQGHPMYKHWTSSQHPSIRHKGALSKGSRHAGARRAQMHPPRCLHMADREQEQAGTGAPDHAPTPCTTRAG